MILVVCLVERCVRRLACRARLSVSWWVPVVTRGRLPSHLSVCVGIGRRVPMTIAPLCHIPLMLSCPSGEPFGGWRSLTVMTA